MAIGTGEIARILRRLHSVYSGQHTTDGIIVVSL